jgi:hypothetical protein
MKKFILLLFWLTGEAILAQVPTLGLVGGWPFTGNANDMKANLNHGSVSGATLTTDRFNQPNCAYNFNGTSDYIVMLNAGPTGTVSRSVSFWAQTSNTVIQVPFNYGNPSMAGGIWQIVANYNCTGYGFDQSTAAAIRGNTTTVDNTWHHIVAIQNSSVGITVGSIQIYVDGVLQPSITCFVTSTAATINTNNVFPITIGRGSSSNVRYFKGKLDDFYMYDRVLTPAEVIQIYNDAPCAGPPTTPGTVNGNASICSSLATTYSVAPVTGATSYTWTLPGGWTGTSSTNTISVISNGTSGNVSVVAGNPCGQSGVSTISVISKASPTVSISSEITTLCKGNIANLSGAGANTYTWTNGSIIAQNISVSPTVTTSYTVTGTNSLGCTGFAVTTITVTNNPLPTIQTSGSGTSCAGQTVNIAANGASTYTWQPGNINGFLVTISPSVTTTYTVTGTDGNGCWNSAVFTQVITICNGVTEFNADQQPKIFPNPFNERIVILSQTKLPCDIEIYNALGALIYSDHSQIGNFEVRLNNVDAGIYLLKVNDEKGTSLHKIIKQ